MKLILFLLVTACSFVAFAFSDEEGDKPTVTPITSAVDPSLIPSLVNLTSMPTAIVNGSVNVITGDLCEYGEEDSLFSPDPYVLGHSYFSSSLEPGSLGDGWNFLHHHLIEVYQPNSISYTKAHFKPEFHLLPIQGLVEKNIGSVRDRVRDRANNHAHNEHYKEGPLPRKNPIFLSLFDPAGGRLLYKAKYDEDHKEKSLRHFALVSELTGYTNIVDGKMSGQTNLKNITVRWDKKSDTFHVHLGDGTTRIYARRAKKKEMRRKDSKRAKQYRDYQLIQELRPNGNSLTYSYNDKHEIIKISAHNRNESKELYSVQFNQRTTGDFAKHPTLDVHTSDNRQHTYYFKRLEGGYMDGTYSVSHIRRQGHPFINFIYSEKSPRHARRVVKKEIEGGFYTHTKYYRPSDNWMNSRTVTPKNKKERRFLQNRVRMQSSPIGPNGEEVITHRYFYYKDGENAGHCTVRDAYNNISRYFWNEDKRLICITKCDNADKKILSEKYYWDKNGTEDEGRLICRVLEEENDKPLLANTYVYDSRGNVIEESLYGNITEHSSELVVHNGRPQGADKQTRRYSYSSDGYNLVTSMQDPLGNYTFYEYAEGTNLLKAKFICDEKKIKKREFFEYEANAIVTEHIVDDGSTRDKNDLRDATERHITKFKLRSIQPRLGEPEEVLEFFYDFAKNKEVFLKKTVNYFNEKGFCIKQEHIDQLGGSLFYEYEYDDVGRIVYSKDPLGRVEHTEYDKAGRIITKKGPRNDVVLHYEYDLAGRCISEREKHDGGLELRIQYEYDLLGRKVAVSDVHNNITRYEYDLLNRITAIYYPAIYNHQGKKITPKKSYSYKQLGRNVTETDENGLVTRTKYNVLGKLCEKQFPDGTKLYSHYDIGGNLIKEVAKNGAVNQLEYDAFCRHTKSKLLKDNTLIAQKEVRYNSFHPVEEISPTGEKTTYSYDWAGRCSQIQIQGTRTTKFVYDARGCLYRQRSFLADGGFVGKRFKYDDLNRLTYESVRDHKKRVRSYKEYGYDLEGNLSTLYQKIGSELATSCSTFLAGGLIESKTDPFGNQMRYRYDYDHINAYGQKVLAKICINPQGRQDEEIFDARGNLAECISYDPSKRVLAKKEYFYDAANTLVRTNEYALSEGTVLKKITTCFVYKAGQLITLIEAKNTPEQKSTTFTYNKYGQRSSSTFQDGTIIHYRYDAKGRIKRFFAHDKSIDYRYRYDASDRILSITNALTGKATKRSYNSFGELECETLETGFSLNYGYDDIGRVSSMTLPDGSKVLYEHSAFLEKVIRQDAAGAERYSHSIMKRDLSGHINTATLANGSKIRYEHDKLGRCKKISHDAFTETATGFDEVGNLLGIESKDRDGRFTHCYSYDYLSQLTQEDESTYSYDSLYNRLRCNEMTYVHNSLHAILSDGINEYQYDARGNRVAHGDTRYSYDALDRLIEVTIEGTRRYVYGYDGCNRRIKKESYILQPFGWQKELAENYLYSLDNEIGSIDAEGHIKELRILGEGLGAEIGAGIAYEFDGESFVPIHNRQGSVALLVDFDGNVFEDYRYDAFGNRTWGTFSPRNPWRFASKRCDDETGLINFGRRYYDPTVGKWLTQDPLGLKAGPNLYAYCLNNPLTNFDLYGLLESNENRTLTDRVKDFFSDIARGARNAVCYSIEKIVHHAPHIGSYNDRIENKLREYRGATPKTQRAAGMHKIKSGTMTAKGTTAHAYANGLFCDYDEAVSNLEQITQEYITVGGSHPDMYVLYSPSEGICMDFIRAIYNCFGGEGSNIDPIAQGMKELSNDAIARGGHWVLNPHSNGGQTTYLASKQLSRQQKNHIHVESIASTKMFAKGQGFGEARNHSTWSDLTSLISDPIGVLYRGIFGQGDVQMVGHLIHIPCGQHAYLSKEHASVLKKIAGKHG